MKKYIALLTAWVICMLIFIGWNVYYKKYEGTKYDELAIPYIENVVETLSRWDPVATKQLMAPEIAATIPADKYQRAMDFFSQLGALQSFEKPEFQKAFQDEETDLGTQTIVEYNVDARYEKGDAELNLKLLERNNAYEIYRFNFSSEALMPED